MSDRKRNRSYWMTVLGSMVLTIVALFGMQEWYRTYMLVSSGGLGAEVGAEVEALKRSHREELATGRMPIDRAMRLIVERGRTASALVIPESSTDPGPASGWLHHPDYEGPPQVAEEAEDAEQVEPGPSPEGEGAAADVEEGGAEPADSVEQPATPAPPQPETGAQPARRPAKQQPAQPRPEAAQ